MGNANSGRRTLGDRQKRQAIIDKSWETIREFLDDSAQPLEKRAEMAIKVIVKDMPNKLTDGDGNSLPVPIINVYGNRDASNQLLRSPEGDPNSGEGRLPV